MGIDEFLSGPLTSAIGLVLAGGSLVLAYVFYKRSQRNKEPSWDIKSVNLVRNLTSSLQGLSIAYAGRNVSNVSVSRLIFWNNGRMTINRGDIPPLDPLRIEVTPGIQLLHISVIATNKPANEFRLVPSENGTTALIHFEYLDKGDGAVIQLVHDGLDSSAIGLLGTVKGALPPKQRPVAQPSSPRFLPTRIRRAIALAALYFVLLLTMGCNASIILSSALAGELPSGYGGMFLFALLVALGAIINILAWRYPCPRGLEIYLDDPAPRVRGA